MKEIKYCIWDVGEVIYRYSLNPLNTYLKSQSKNLNTFLKRKEKFSYDEYMRGEISFEKLCENLCDYYGVDNINTDEIRKYFIKGIGHYFKETQDSISYLKSLGITNGILSNALPVLKHSLDNIEELDREYFFKSYDMGMLKPEKAIYQKVIETLNTEPNEIIVIDDKLKNIKAAKNLGITTIHFNNKTLIKNISDILKSNNI